MHDDLGGFVRKVVGYLIIWFAFGAVWTVGMFLFDKAIGDHPLLQEEVVFGFGFSTGLMLFVSAMGLGISLMSERQPVVRKRQ